MNRFSPISKKRRRPIPAPDCEPGRLAVVLGMGNPLLSDDAAGLLIVDRLCEGYARRYPDVAFKRNYCGGIDMLTDLEGHPRAVIVDAVHSGQAAPGTFLEFSLRDFEGLSQPRLADSHGVNLPTVLEIGDRLGLRMPGEIVIFGIEGVEFNEFSQAPTRAVLHAMPEVISGIEKKLAKWRKEEKENKKANGPETHHRH